MIDSPTHRTTKLILRGTLIATTLLYALLTTYHVELYSIWNNWLSLIAIVAIVYLLLIELLLHFNRQIIANWMLIIFYETLAITVLFIWGINSPVGIFTMCFAIMLPSILMNPKAVFPIIAITITALIFLQFIHSNSAITTNLISVSRPSTLWDVIIYSIVLAIFALVSWLSGEQREKALKRALYAESQLQTQRDILSNELEKESSVLRLTQLKQIREFHKFAFIGQTTAATLHELSSHLCVLHIDINDLEKQHANSQAISNAKESIQHINKMLSVAKHQLNSYERHETFDACRVIERCLKDMRGKFLYQKVKLVKNPTRKVSFFVTGSTVALMQIVTILINNALEACRDTPNSKITISLKRASGHLVVSVLDNGPGIESKVKQSLFKPVTSAKPMGMGVGLYIAHHLAANQLGGSLRLKDRKHGTHFIITIPQAKSVIKNEQKATSKIPEAALAT